MDLTGKRAFRARRSNPLVRDVVDEELRNHGRQVALVVTSVVGAGVMLTFALGMAGVALLAPDADTLLASLGAAGAVPLLCGIWLFRRE